VFRETLGFKRKKLGPEHRSTLVTMGNLADTLTDEGKYSEAEQLVRETLQTEQRTLGPDHTDTLSTTMGLAQVLKKEKRYAESEFLNGRSTVCAARSAPSIPTPQRQLMI